MLAPPYVEDVPIRLDEHGVMRVGGTRVILDIVIGAFNQGETPEQIVDSYDVLKLADVYDVIAFYLRHKDEIDAYILRREKEAELLRAEIEARHPEMQGIKERLLARLEEKRRGNS